MLSLFALVALFQEPYRTPHSSIVDVVDAPPPPSVQISPDGTRLLLVERSALPPIEDLVRPMLRLAGVRIDPAADAPWQSSYYEGFAVRALEGGPEQEVELPSGARLARVSWSPDGQHIVYALVREGGTELRLAAADEPARGRTLTRRLNGVLARYTWSADSQSLFLFEVPADRGAAPVADPVPSGPNVQETAAGSSPLRTYQDLLTNPHDAALFLHHATSQLVRVDVASGERTTLGAPRLYQSLRTSPDGEHLLVTYLTGEVAYDLTYRSFPQHVEVWSAAGELEQRVAEVPMGYGIPVGGVRTGRRNADWLASHDATLVWAEALDGGDPKKEVPHRDQLMLWSAPFDAAPSELVRVEHRSWGVTALADPNLLITNEYDRDRRWVRALLHDLSRPEATPKVLEDRSIRDRYGDPGNLVMQRDARGRWLPVQHGSFVYREGAGASEDGSLPFLDRQNLETLATERLWRCEPGSYEAVVDMLPSSAGRAPVFVTRHETPTSPPNYRLHGASDEPRALTAFADPTPSIRGIRKELVTYERDDGVTLSATLYLPPNHEEGDRLPLLVWAYPREFNDAATASQVSGSPSRFTRIAGSSHLALLLRGYAIMDGATMPVIGDAETMNDTFREQIVAAAQAAIDYAAGRGVADPERVGVGGHSYGAFMTANLLAHCDLFRAGVARSGAYNRTLTPFGFQAERRTFWEAPETYFSVSPFMHADKINEPLLMIHGEMDNNSGTYPIQSKRMFQAIQGNGGTARLVMLPHESHGYRARESVLQTLAEMEDWFDRYLKGAVAAEASAEVEGTE